MKKEKDISILAIETSCDETGAAVVRNGREVLSNIIYSQIDLHKEYGGVVPEIASATPTSNAPTNPGPYVTATADNSVRGIPPLSSAASMT